MTKRLTMLLLGNEWVRLLNFLIGENDMCEVIDFPTPRERAGISMEEDMNLLIRVSTSVTEAAMSESFRKRWRTILPSQPLQRTAHAAADR